LVLNVHCALCSTGRICQPLLSNIDSAVSSPRSQTGACLRTAVSRSSETSGTIFRWRQRRRARRGAKTFTEAKRQEVLVCQQRISREGQRGHRIL